jgi:hypothetical protein
LELQKAGRSLDRQLAEYNVVTVTFKPCIHHTRFRFFLQLLK